jgi:hypothetical protein
MASYEMLALFVIFGQAVTNVDWPNGTGSWWC